MSVCTPASASSCPTPLVKLYPCNPSNNPGSATAWTRAHRSRTSAVRKPNVFTRKPNRYLIKPPWRRTVIPFYCCCCVSVCIRQTLPQLRSTAKSRQQSRRLPPRCRYASLSQRRRPVRLLPSFQGPTVRVCKAVRRNTHSDHLCLP
jgi:hypothetical protein